MTHVSQYLGSKKIAWARITCQGHSKNKPKAQLVLHSSRFFASNNHWLHLRVAGGSLYYDTWLSSTSQKGFCRTHIWDRVRVWVRGEWPVSSTLARGFNILCSTFLFTDDCLRVSLIHLVTPVVPTPKVLFWLPRSWWLTEEVPAEGSIRSLGIRSLRH